LNYIWIVELTVIIGRLVDALEAYQKAQEQSNINKKPSLKFRKVMSINEKSGDQPCFTVSKFEEDKYENFNNKQTITGSAKPLIISDRVRNFDDF
jgi:hypothetical protein